MQLEVRLARSPFRLQKRISLDSRRPLLHVWERVTNESRQRRPYIWGQHPAFGAPFLAGGCRLDVPAGGYVAADPQVSPRSPVVPGARSRWPHATSARATDAAGQQQVDLSVVPPPEAEVDTLGFLVDLSAGWYALSNDALGLGLALTWPLEVFSCLWLWQELGGTLDYPWYGAAYVMGVEPHTSCPAVPNRAIRSDSRRLRGYESELRNKRWQGDGQLLTFRRTLGAARRPAWLAYF